MSRKRFRLGYEQRHKLGGFLFTLPFVIGFILFFLYPFIQAVIFSFNELVLTSSTYELEWQGLSNYGYALQVHPEFSRIFTEVLVKLATELPLILGFSLFAATLLNQRFRGRPIVRALFFLPVILGAGVALKLEMSDYSQIMLQAAQDASPVGAALRTLFERAHLPQGMVDFVMDAIRSLPMVIRASGVQILIFLAGLQGISREVYEAANVEGATGWEQFWLITFPMLTPLIVTNLVYTIIDSFTTMNNELVLLIRETMQRGAGYGASMAMAMLYFSVIAVILIIVYGISSKWAFYHV